MSGNRGCNDQISLAMSDVTSKNDDSDPSSSTDVEDPFEEDPSTVAIKKKEKGRVKKRLLGSLQTLRLLSAYHIGP